MAGATAGTGDGRGSAVVLLEDADGSLEIAATSAPLPASLPIRDGARLADLVAEEDRGDLAATHAAMQAAGAPRACRVRLSGAGFIGRWYEVQLLPGLVADRTVVLLRDVTRQQRQAAESALLRRMTELANAGSDIDDVAARAVADICTTMDWRAGHVIDVGSGTLTDLGGWHADPDTDELVDRLRETAPLENARVVAVAVDRAAPATSSDTPEAPRLETVRATGIQSVVALPIIADGEVVRVLELFAATPVVLDDAQRALLLQIGQQLGSVMVRRQQVEQIEESRDQLQRSNAELERFAYVASHDLQEPLRKIIGFTELLRDRYEARDEEEREFREYVVESAHRLQRLIKDLLAYSRAGRRELAAGPVDMDQVIDDVMSDLELAIEDAGATVEVRDLPAVRGDADQLREVFQNLVSNALKYAAVERPPRIEITGQVEPPHARIVVADNGIGVAPEHRQEIFEVFRRLHPAHAYGGTGLGLALAKRIIERHGGTIQVRDSPLGHGIAVDVLLPLEQER